MDNIEFTINEETQQLTLTIDLKKQVGPSSTGKSIIVATSHGYNQIGTLGSKKLALSLNLIKK